MKTVILCGGQGTRIREASEALPKPMLSIGGKPLVWHVMKSYAKHGFNEFVLCLGYKGWQVKQFFLNYEEMEADLHIDLASARAETLRQGKTEDWKVVLAETGEHTMTGGRVTAIRRYVEEDDIFALTYADGLSDLDIADLVRFHKSHGKAMTVTAVHPPGRFGEMRLDDELVTEFREKPESESFINGGFFVCDAKRIWDFIEDSPNTVLEREPLQKLAAAGELAAYKHTGFWQCMDTFREFTMLNDLWASSTAPWKTW